MLGLGPIFRTIRGTLESRRLDEKKARLKSLARRGPLSLSPEAFRPCAELRLGVAEREVADAADRPRLEEEIVRRFENIRKRGLEAMMEQAAAEPVTRDEMTRLVHTLDQYARAAQAEIEQ